MEESKMKQNRKKNESWLENLSLVDINGPNEDLAYK